MNKLLLSLIAIIGLTRCESLSPELMQQSAQILLGGANTPLTQKEASLGIKEALSIGIKKGVQVVGKKDGFLKNPLIAVTWPEEAKRVKTTLNSIGLNSLTAKAETSMNRAAEQAAELALPLFLNAISSMTLQDALGLIKGGEGAATNFLKTKTEGELVKQFRPKITESLNKVEATKYWGLVMGKYNRIPLVKKVNPSLENYVTEQAISGLFKMVAKEEANIRKNPVARTSALLKRVFK